MSVYRLPLVLKLHSRILARQPCIRNLVMLNGLPGCDVTFVIGRERKTYNQDGRECIHDVTSVRSGTCNFFQVTGQIATLKWSRGPDNVTRVNEG